MQIHTVTCYNPKNSQCFTFEVFSKEALEIEEAKMRKFGLIVFHHSEYVDFN